MQKQQTLVSLNKHSVDKCSKLQTGPACNPLPAIVRLDQCCTKKTSSATNRTINQETSTTISNEAENWLAQNKPNPFNKETVIEYNIVQEGKGSIMIFDMNGKLLKSIPVKIPGKGSISINAKDFTAGMYYYSLVVNDIEVDTKKMILTE